MIIAFALGLIGALLVLANNKYFRNHLILVIAYAATTGMAYTGIYLLKHASPKTDILILFPMFTPVTALVLLHIARILFKRKSRKDIILYMRGLFPVRNEERFVTRSEIYITFTILVSSVIIPYAIMKILV